VSKLISQIKNYPLSSGAVAYSNKLLLDDRYAIQQNKLNDYLKFLFEISGNINFFNEMGINSSTWRDLLKQETTFQLARFLTINSEDLLKYFVELPQSNHFYSDTELSQDEYEILCYQRLQVIQYLFLFYKSVSETIGNENQQQIEAILKNESVSRLFVQYTELSNEALPVIKTTNRTRTANFNEIVFEPIDDGITNTLNSWFNPLNLKGSEVLTVYGDDYDTIKAANEYAFTIFKSILQIHQKFTSWATNRLTELVTSTTGHAPHTALLIAFSKLKMWYDARYNQLIHQHTTFFFNDILQLKKQSVLPDSAYVTLELARNINQYFIGKETLFKAGKNSKGKPVYYKSTRDLVLNNAQIVALKSCVRISSQNQFRAVFATEDAASPQWQVNNAWIPFNDIAESYTGIGFESELIESVTQKDTEINFEFTFDKEIPAVTDLSEKFEVKIMLEDDSELSLRITEVKISDDNSDIILDKKVLTIKASVADDLTIAVKKGINARIKLISPGKEEQNDGYVDLYKYLLSEHIGKVKVKLIRQRFAPGSVKTASATFGASVSFVAFGSQSLAGSSFRIAHPFLKYAGQINLTLNWEENLKEDIEVEIAGKEKIFQSGTNVTEISGFDNNNSNSIRIQLAKDVTYTKITNVASRNITSTLPRILLVKSIDIEADLEEDIYGAENSLPLRRTEFLRSGSNRSKSLSLSSSKKSKQKQELLKRHEDSMVRIKREHHNKLIVHLYPLGELLVFKSSALTFLPDYIPNGFSDYAADLYIGFSGIIPGQNISLLFDIADETAAQSIMEAKISWHYLSNNEIKIIDAGKITDTTSNFLQTGIVQLMLPEDATNSNSIVEGKDTFWLVARCDSNYEVVANIRSVKTNAIAVIRVLDDSNDEAKISVAPGTIENVYPKTANIKSVEQFLPSQNGREEEDDKHYFWRSSQLLRHKQRAVTQWDFEQLVLEKFPGIYKVKCLNHAWYNEVNEKIHARSSSTLISVLPHFRVNPENANFQPSLSISKLIDVKAYLQNKTSAFNKLQVVNTSWDIVRIEINAMLNKGIMDVPFYQQQLDEDLKKFLAPWAYEKQTALFNQQKIYVATLVDFIDELPYIHHIRQFKIFKNGIEQFDKVVPSTEIHLLTSASSHKPNLVEYAH
jgi:hypothetical protein